MKVVSQGEKGCALSGAGADEGRCGDPCAARGWHLDLSLGPGREPHLEMEPELSPWLGPVLSLSPESGLTWGHG